MRTTAHRLAVSLPLTAAAAVVFFLLCALTAAAGDTDIDDSRGGSNPRLLLHLPPAAAAVADGQSADGAPRRSLGTGGGGGGALLRGLKSCGKDPDVSSPTDKPLPKPTDKPDPSVPAHKPDDGGGEETSDTACTEDHKCKFLIITDLDGGSKTGSSYEYQAYLKEGELYKDKSGKYHAKLGKETKIESKYNEGGRGMELSELIFFGGHLLSFDDKSGIVFEIAGDEARPREIYMEGDGDEDEGMKIEWATIKDGKLWVGSHGDSTSRNFVVTLNTHGEKTWIDWKKMYEKVEDALDADECNHEAVIWSQRQKKWIFCPRRVEYKGKSSGHHKMVVCNEECSDAKVFDVGTAKSGVGFSAIRFVPGTDEEVILAVKSEEHDSSQKSFLTVFTIDGEILMSDVTASSSKKYEGLTFKQ